MPRQPKKKPRQQPPKRKRKVETRKITKEQFHKILDKASQPRKPKSGSR